MAHLVDIVYDLELLNYTGNIHTSLKKSASIQSLKMPDNRTTIRNQIYWAASLQCLAFA